MNILTSDRQSTTHVRLTKKIAVQYGGKKLKLKDKKAFMIIQSFIKTDMSAGREPAILRHPTADLSPTWSVQVMLLESVMEGPLTEQHCTGTYPQIQDPGHCRDHCHSLNKILDRRYYPLPDGTQNSQLPLQQYFQNICTPFAKCLLSPGYYSPLQDATVIQQRSCAKRTAR